MITLGFHAGVVVCKILGGDCSVFIPEVFEELNWNAATKFRDWIFESGEIFSGHLFVIIKTKMI